MRVRLFPALAALFIGLPMLDVILLLFLGRYIGFWTSLAFVIASGLLGAWLAKREGVRVWYSIQRDLAEGRMPSQGVMDGVLILVAGGLLAAPGFVTDILGMALLVPTVRVPIKAFLRRRLEEAMLQRS
jgi:UPF0716 protein FxsA